MAILNSRGANLALIVGHMAGMIDIAALPVWVGTLIAGYGLQPAQAGGLATLFLGGVVVSSVLLSRFFHLLPGRWVPPAGFLVSALAFAAMSTQTGFGALAICHLIAGLSTGLAISFVHGTMARTNSPHRIFALGGLALGIFAVVFLGTAPQLIAAHGPQVLFVILAGIMATGALVTLLLFPTATHGEDVLSDGTRFNRAVWLTILGIMCMALVHAMIFSFVERVGAGRGFSPEQVQTALVVSGFVAILPSLLAALLEKRLPALGVAVTGAILQAVIAGVIATTTGFPVYLVATAAFPFVILFSHTFVFGHLARIEPTGRANAATPAMIMTGSATGPLLAGVLVQSSGFPALGIAAAVIAVIAVTAFTLSRGQTAQAPEAQP